MRGRIQGRDSGDGEGPDHESDLAPRVCLAPIGGEHHFQDQLIPLANLDGDLETVLGPTLDGQRIAVERGGTESGHAPEGQPERLTSEIEAGPAELARQSELAGTCRDVTKG